MSHRLVWLVLIPTLLLGGTTRVTAQPERYELGRRLRVFEATWDRQPDPEGRLRTTESLQRSVMSFFAFQFGQAGRQLTLARQALVSPEALTPAQSWAESLYFQPTRRLIDVADGGLNGTLARFYTVDATAPEGARIVITLGAKPSADVPIHAEKLPQILPLELANATEGDHLLKTAIVAEGRTLAQSSIGLSVVKDLPERLGALKAAVAAWPDDAPATTDRETARALLALAERFRDGAVLETDYPLARLLGEAEALVAAIAEGQPFYGPARSGQSWLTMVLPSGGKMAVRLQIPPRAAEGKSLPLVVALHGAGGSENMFFDGYGDGAVTKRCAERGWLLVSPRGNGLGAAQIAGLVDAMAQLYPVDRSKVMLVGHSMGAMQAVGAASQAPGKYAAVAALGGGGRVRPAPELTALPFFIGIGAADFALSGAKSLNQSLKAAEVRDVEYHEYPAIEHLAIVQVALPEVFAFFDKSVNTSK